MTIDKAANRRAGWMLVEGVVVISVVAVGWMMAMLGSKKMGCVHKTKAPQDVFNLAVSAKRSFCLVVNQPMFVMGRLLKKG